MTALHAEAPDERIVRDIRKNSKESARVQLRTYEGVRLVDVRAYAHQPDGSMLPTKKGISLNVNCLRELIDVLCDAERIARQMGWLAADRSKQKAA